MQQISLAEAELLLDKLLSERTPVRCIFKSSSGFDALTQGFVDSKTPGKGVVVSTSGPPIDVEKGFVRFRPFNDRSLAWYGEKRELPEEDRADVSESFGESALTFTFPEFNERLHIFFTIPL
jgi:hypothetical protein